MSEIKTSQNEEITNTFFQGDVFFGIVEILEGSNEWAVRFVYSPYYFDLFTDNEDKDNSEFLQFIDEHYDELVMLIDQAREEKQR